MLDIRSKEYNLYLRKLSGFINKLNLTKGDSDQKDLVYENFKQNGRCMRRYKHFFYFEK